MLRLIDFYLGDKSPVPQKSLLQSPACDGDVNETMIKKVTMGDKYNQPNFTNLLSLLGTLLRSGICQHDNVDISDSSEDEDNLVDVDAKEGSDVRLSLLSTHAREDMDEVGVLFELPVRDSWTASRSELSQKILDEVSFTQAPSAGVPIAGGKMLHRSSIQIDQRKTQLMACRTFFFSWLEGFQDAFIRKEKGSLL